MPQALVFLAPVTFGVGGPLALLAGTTIAGVTTITGLTALGSLVSIGGGLLLSAAAGALKGQPASVQPENITLNLKQAIGDRVRHIGRVRTGGTVVFARAREGKLYRVIVHGHGRIDGIEERLLDQRVVDMDGTWVDDEQYESDGQRLVKIETRVGAVPSTAFSALTAIWPEWDADHRLDGLCASLLIAESVDPEDFNRVYPNREPSLALTIRGARLRDPRTGTTVWSDNAALAMADHIEHADGFNLEGWLDDDTLEQAADDCDEAIPLAGGGTEPRYRLSGSYSLTEEPGAVLRRMQAACRGDVQLLPSGKIGIYVGRWRTPDVTLRRDELIEISSWASGPDALDRYTELPFKYVDPTLAYQVTTGDTWEDEDREDENGGEAATGPEADYTFCPSHTQGRRLAQQQIERDNPAFTITARFRPSARRALYERFIGLDVAELPVAWWRVQSYRLSLADGSLSLTLAAYDPPTWSSAYEGEPQVLPDPDTEQPIPAPTGFAAAGAGTKTAQNSYTAGIGVVWGARPSVALAPVLQYSVAGAGDWDSWPVPAKATSAKITPLADGGTYDVRLAWKSNDDNQSAWVTEQDVEALADVSAPAAPTGLAVTETTAGEARVALTTSSSANLWKTQILRDGVVVATSYAGPSSAIVVIDTCGAGSFTWTAKSVNVSNVASAATAGVAKDIFKASSAAGTAGNGAATFTGTAPAPASVTKLRLKRATTGAGYGAAVTVGTDQTVTPGAAFTATFGNAQANLISNADFASGATGWTLGTGWTVGSGVASHAGGVQGSLDQALVIASGASVRLGFDLTAVSAGGVGWRLVGATTVAGTTRTAVGRYATTLTAPATMTTVRQLANAAFVGSIDNLVAFVDAAGTLTQGAADFWIVPVDPTSGTEGAPSGPFSLTIT